MSKNKFLISGALAAMVLVVGVFAFIPVQQANTVHFQLIDAINGFPGVTNQDIAEELKDKIKLMVNVTDNEFFIPEETEFGFVDGYNILVEALDENDENVIFNLKEVYLCGGFLGTGSIVLDWIYIENLEFDPDTNRVSKFDIRISEDFGGPLDLELFTDDGCVDIISELADSGRAGANGLGSDEELVIEIDGTTFSLITSVKCIAFTPNAAEELICDIIPLFTDEGPD